MRAWMVVEKPVVSSIACKGCRGRRGKRHSVVTRWRMPPEKLVRVVMTLFGLGMPTMASHEKLDGSASASSLEGSHGEPSHPTGSQWCMEPGLAGRRILEDVVAMSLPPMSCICSSLARRTGPR